MKCGINLQGEKELLLHRKLKLHLVLRVYHIS